MKSVAIIFLILHFTFALNSSDANSEKNNLLPREKISNKFELINSELAASNGTARETRWSYYYIGI